MAHHPEDGAQSGAPKEPAPAPWERRPAGGIKETLETGEQLYTGVEGEAGYLADDQASLHSKLRGGGRDLGGNADEEYTKLCPACKTVTGFVQGVCSSCNYRDGDPLPDLPRGFETPAANPAVIGGLIAAIVVVVLIVLGFIYGPKLLNRQAEPAAGEPQARTNEPAKAAAQVAPAETSAEGGFADGLNAVTINDAFHSTLSAALEKGNAAWADAGTDCYVYRYNIFETTVPATRQDVTVTCFIGGADAEQCTGAPGDAAFRSGLQPWVDAQNMRAGVSAILRLTYTAEGSMPNDNDHYLRYGYWYGQDHWSLLEPVVEGLESLRTSKGQYPESLSEGLVHGKLQTHGGISFIANGVGYLPVFKTDANGHIIMGTGKGIASFMPEECTDYYLVLFLQTDNLGLDMFSPDDLKYYRDKIQPFPYSPDAPLTNMPLNPDGEPDGIACIVKNGKLLD